ncbi:hypothetical protein JCM5350_005963 [Sporobolomyces pararoseus]
MSSLVPLIQHSSSSRLGALNRLRLIGSHLSPSSPTTSTTSLPRSRLNTRQFSNSSSVKQRRDQFTFTTACSFRGKPGSPIYTLPTSSSSSSSSTSTDDTTKDGGKFKLKQGLNSSHPLSKWRDEQLEKSPNGAGHDWFFVQGIPTNGDSQLLEQEGAKPGDDNEEKIKIIGIKGVVLGVADGVGGWEESGVDPSHFSQALMWFSKEIIKNGQFELKKGGKGLKELLDQAFEMVLKEKEILAGSSTACLVALDSETGKLHAANLGDSSFMILRPQSQQLATPPPSPNPSPSSDTSNSSSPETTAPTYTVIHSEPSQTHFFNAPYQLSKLPPSSRAGAADNSLMDSASDAATTPKGGIQLREGDVVVLSTDGFGDNVFNEEMEQLCKLVHEKCLEQQGGSVDGGGEDSSRVVDPHLLASSLSQTSLNFARLVMFKKDKVTPFEVEARKYGYGRNSGLGGGKVDDVTVVVAVVGKN